MPGCSRARRGSARPASPTAPPATCWARVPIPAPGRSGRAPDDPVSRMVSAQSHPDLMVLERHVEGGAARKSIPVDEARRLPEFFSKAPALSPYRVAIIDAADDLNVNAANAVLKTLEEPSGRGVLLLVSHAPGRLLTTIRSRCRRLAFAPWPEAALAAFAAERLQVDEAKTPCGWPAWRTARPGGCCRSPLPAPWRWTTRRPSCCRPGSAAQRDADALRLADRFRGGEGAQTFALLLERLGERLRLAALGAATAGSAETWAGLWRRTRRPAGSRGGAEPGPRRRLLEPAGRSCAPRCAGRGRRHADRQPRQPARPSLRRGPRRGDRPRPPSRHRADAHHLRPAVQLPCGRRPSRRPSPTSGAPWASIPTRPRTTRGWTSRRRSSTTPGAVEWWGSARRGSTTITTSVPASSSARVFAAHIAAAQASGLPLVVHTREADEDMAQMLEAAHQRQPFKLLMHCYTSGAELARRAAALGAWFSVSGIATFKAAEDVRKVIADMPSDRILVETDCPYLAPVPMRGSAQRARLPVPRAGQAGGGARLVPGGGGGAHEPKPSSPCSTRSHAHERTPALHDPGLRLLRRGAAGGRGVGPLRPGRAEEPPLPLLHARAAGGRDGGRAGDHPADRHLAGPALPDLGGAGAAAGRGALHPRPRRPGARHRRPAGLLPDQPPAHALLHGPGDHRNPEAAVRLHLRDPQRLPGHLRPAGAAAARQALGGSRGPPAPSRS